MIPHPGDTICNYNPKDTRYPVETNNTPVRERSINSCLIGIEGHTDRLEEIINGISIYLTGVTMLDANECKAHGMMERAEMLDSRLSHAVLELENIKRAITGE